MPTPKSKYNAPYRGERLNHIAFPLGGIGAGMLCLEGTGALSHVSLGHRPEVFKEPMVFSAIFARRTGRRGGSAPAGGRAPGVARILEGPVPKWKTFGTPGAGNGLNGKTYGLPRFANARFTTRFPFGTIRLEDPHMPVSVDLIGWSPFTPGDADSSSLPVAALEYRIENRSREPVAAVYSFHATNFMPSWADTDSTVAPIDGGFALLQPALQEKPWEQGAFGAFLDERGTRVDCAWFRGGWFDPLTINWQHVAAGRAPANPPHAQGIPGKPTRGASLYLPFKLKGGEARTIRLHLAWYVPESNLRTGTDLQPAAGAPITYRPWYASRFASLTELASYWRTNYGRLRAASAAFADCFYDTTLPPEVVEAVAANLTILKSPTCLRQHDGRLWAWEGCRDDAGCCEGSCTHVWNYAQALPHLFPDLERTLRETEYQVDQDDSGHQNFRAFLPIRQPDHQFHAAADGQLGGMVKAYRDWRISGDTAWLKTLWPSIRQSMDYCITTWDPDHTGTLVEPHHNTYDIEFWGPDGMCTSFYLSALGATIAMGKACGADVSLYETLLASGKAAMEKRLYNGDYFFQRVEWKNLRAKDPSTTHAWNVDYSPEARNILEKEGPKYQYGTGCLSDGVLGDWLARVSGLPPVLSAAKVASHLDAVFAHNFKPDLSQHANPQRPGYAFGREGGLLACSWPRGSKPALPFPYSEEVWTGMEYHVAAHLIMMGRIQQGLKIVRAARDRYDGRWRNPFNEYECGHWYARAMSSYSLLQAFSGARYDAVEKTLYLHPRIKGDFRAFLCTATGFATVGVRKGKPFCDVRQGTIAVGKIDYQKA